MSRKQEPRFSGEELARCRELAPWGDLARALLDEKKEYTKTEARKRLNKFMERQVKS